MRKECFVAQCFDGGVYDRRYRETFAPAIQAAGATPVRADEALGTRPIIEKIELSLRKSTIAFAEVSEDNCNVFLELGYAIALGLPTVIVCDKSKRERLPFDIQHRPVIFYAAEAQSDFDKLQTDITKNVQAALAEAAEKSDIFVDSSNLSSTDIDATKRRCLLELLDQTMRTHSGASLWELQKAMVGTDCTERMVALAMASLLTEGLVEMTQESDYDGDTYTGWILSEAGRLLILREYSALMKMEQAKLRSQNTKMVVDSLDDNAPF